MHIFWRRWLAGRRCRCWIDGMPGQMPVGRRSWAVPNLRIVANVAIAAGPALVGVPWSLCQNCLYYMYVWILESRCPRQTLREGAYILHTLHKSFIRWKQVQFFILSCNLLLREGPFHIVFVWNHLILNCSLSTHWSCWRYALAHKFCLNLTTIWLVSELSKCASRVVSFLRGNTWERRSHTFFTFCFKMSWKLF